MKKNITIIICFYFLALYSYSYANCSEPSVLIFPDANSRDTYFTMHNIKAAQAISQGKGCKVGILDHSFGMVLHPGLYAGGKNFVENGDESLNKKEWHGYWMAVTFHEIAPKAKIYALNAISFKSPKSNVYAIIKAINWAIKNHLDVLTYSQPTIQGEDRKILDKALDRAHNAGIITTFIHIGHPDNILPSGLWNEKEDGRYPDINVLQYDYTVVKVNWNTKSSTENSTTSKFYSPFLSISSTSPVVGGVVALMKSLRPNLSSKECQKILRETAYQLNYKGEKPPRVLDALAAVKRTIQSD
jgi:subtilisin family serine protease